jgi:hypothetical protein
MIRSLIQSKIQNPKSKISGHEILLRLLILLGILLTSLSAYAHVGSPDVFYDGKVGPYPARITIRMPNVVPGRAEISVRVQSAEPVEVSFLPLYSLTAVTNAPPPDIGRLVTGETNLYSGELWLMSFGAYSVEVRIKGQEGEGSSQIPVTSVAIRRLPLPFLLGKVLLVLAAILVVGGIGIAAAAGREAALPPVAADARRSLPLPKGEGRGEGEHDSSIFATSRISTETRNDSGLLTKRDRRNGYFAAAAAAIVFILALVGGKYWWKVEEKSFRRHLLAGAWPDLAASVRLSGNQRILRLQVGRTMFQENNKFPLIPDHGKLMHLFLVRENSRDAFAHLHPIRKEGYTFEVAVPPLPEGRYAVFCDLTFEGGTSSTATNSIVLPPLLNPSATTTAVFESDPDDSWASFATNTIPASTTTAAEYHLPDGAKVTWKSQRPVRAKQDACLKFEVTDSTSEPVALEPYMGMLCHAAVLRSDGSIFAHLHPAGNFSMAAQSFFETKLANETKSESLGPVSADAQDHTMHHHHSGSANSSVYLPYEFPEPGNYRIWVQFKTNGRILTAVFDATVSS